MVQRRRWPLLGLVVAGLVMIPASHAGAATITACVNKKTGDLKIRHGKAAKRKCPKGWSKLRWNATGPQGLPGVAGAPGTNGQQGPAGPAFNVKDATGAVVGQFMGTIPEGVPLYTVLRDGGLYIYLGSGQLLPITNIDYKTNDCSGTAYMQGSNQFAPSIFALLVSGPFRAVFRTSSGGTFGPASVFTGHGTTENVSSVQLYEHNSSTGICQTDGAPVTGYLAPLDPIAAPPDFTGPLTIG